ncbi:MAG: hypothetical protein AAF998_01720 [Bacteroidota bacterium]
MKIRIIDSKSSRAKSFVAFWEARSLQNEVFHRTTIEQITPSDYQLIEEESYDLFMIHLTDQLIHTTGENGFGLYRSGIYLEQINAKFPSTPIFIYSGGAGGCRMYENEDGGYFLEREGEKWRVNLTNLDSIWVCSEPIHSADGLPYGFGTIVDEFRAGLRKFKDSNEKLGDRLSILHQMLVPRSGISKDQFSQLGLSYSLAQSIVNQRDTSLFQVGGKKALLNFFERVTEIREHIIPEIKN